jgi:outer membrane protein OmpA-like peptidoglycan-associated protein
MKLIVQAAILFLPILTVTGQNIFSPINSAANEEQPVLSPDRKTLYFTRANHPSNTAGERDPGDIWYSEMGEDGQWSAPKNASDLNNEGYNAVIGFTIDSRTIYLQNHYNKDNSAATTQGISRAIRRGNGWGKPENITIPYFLNKSNVQSGFITKDGRVLVLSIQGYNTKGSEDIYVCFNEGSKWSEPVNLGSTINSNAQEFTPFLSDDKLTLYYSSNGKGGAGSSDVFMSKRLDETWKNWSDPVPAPVNTQGRELGYRQYEGFAIYSSTTNSDGYSDLQFYSPDDEQEIETVVIDPVEVVEKIETLDRPVIYGTIKHAVTRDPVANASIKISVDGEETMIPLEDGGVYTLPYTMDKRYIIRIDAPGYISTSETLDVTSGSTGGIEKNFLLQPIEVGRTVQMQSVLFKRSTADILPGSYQELDMVVDFMRANPNVKIRLEGHTDNSGVPKHNERLSKARVESVKEYLVGKGISSKRISGKGYGGSQPIADNSNEETRQLNRRVEFTIVKE